MGGAELDRLDPVRWRPRRLAGVVRALVVTGLLVLAAGVLFAGTGRRAAEPVRCRAAPSATHSSPPRDPGAPPAVPRGLVGLPVRVAETGVVDLVRPGDRVDLTGASERAPVAEVLVSDVVVLRGTRGDPSGGEGGSMIYLAMTEDQARRVAGAAPNFRIGVTVRPR